MTYFHSPFEQEDAVQEAFAHLYRQRAHVDPLRPDDLEGFLATVARRKMIDLFRARWPATEPPADAESDAPSPHSEAEAQTLRRLLLDFEDRLKPGFQGFFRRVFVDGEDEAQARAALGLGVLRAKYVKQVVLARLRQHRPLLDFLGRRPDGTRA